MLVCGKRMVRRTAVLLPLLLTAAALLLLPRPQLRRPDTTEQPHHAPLVTRVVTTTTGTELHTVNDDSLMRQDDMTVMTEPAEDEEVVARRPWYMAGGKRRPVHHNNDHLFPDEAPSDRIENQLMYTLPNDANNVPIKRIVIANGVHAFNKALGRQEFLLNKCPVSECSLVPTTAEEVATADAILFKDQITRFNVPRPPNQIWIMYYLECPYHTPGYQNEDVTKNAINWTATYRRDSDIVAPYEKWVYHDPLITQRDQKKDYAKGKTGKVAWFVSNCNANNRRLQYALRLSKFISVDIYGACGTMKCPRFASKDCFALLDTKYKFYLAFENSNCQDYITEKFFVNGLQHNSVPIVMGARSEEYEAAAPYHSYIHVENFAGPQELAEYLTKLDNDDKLYNDYFKWKGTGEFINTYFFCRLCAMLHASDQKNRSSSYPDIRLWWKKNACTKNQWRQTALYNSTDSHRKHVVRIRMTKSVT